MINQPVPTTTLAPVPDPVPATIEPPSSTVPPAEFPSEPPTLEPGAIEVVQAGVRVAVEVVVENDQRDLVMRSESFQLRVAGQCSFTCRISSDGRGGQVLELEENESALVSGEGFQPGSLVDVWLFSEPTLLGRLSVDDDGDFDGSVPLVGVAPGAHTLQVSGRSADGTVRAVSLGVLVAEQGIPTPRPTELPATGRAVDMWFWTVVMVATGLVLLGLRRRPRDAGAERRLGSTP